MSTPILPSLPMLPVSSMPVLSPGFRISKDQLTIIVPVAVVAAFGGYLVSWYMSGRGCSRKCKVNDCVSKDIPRVVHSYDMEDIGSKAVYCRCWRSKKFPFCDGSHVKHNEDTGDNVGPLIIKKKDV